MRTTPSHKVFAGAVVLTLGFGITAPAFAGTYQGGHITASISAEGEEALAQAGVTVTGFDSNLSVLNAEIDETVASLNLPEWFEASDYSLQYLGQGFSYNEDRYDCSAFTKGSVISPNQFSLGTNSLNLRPQTSYWSGGSEARLFRTWIHDFSGVPASQSFTDSLGEAGLKGHNPETFSSVSRGEMGSCVQVFARGVIDESIQTANHIGYVPVSEPVFVSFEGIQTNTNWANLIGEDGWGFRDGIVQNRQESDWLGTNVSDVTYTGSLTSSATWHESEQKELIASVPLSELIKIVRTGDSSFDLVINAPQPFSSAGDVTLPAGNIEVTGDGRLIVNYGVGAWNGTFDVSDFEASSGTYTADDGTEFVLEYRSHSETGVSFYVDGAGDNNFTPRAGGLTLGLGVDDTVRHSASAHISVWTKQWGLNALADRASTSEDASVSVNLIANDFTMDWQGNESSIVEASTTVALTSQPEHGTAVLTSYGLAQYTPAEGFSGTDSFTYSITNDGVIRTATVTVTVLANVDPVNPVDPPVDPVEPPVAPPVNPPTDPTPVDPTSPPVVTPPDAEKPTSPVAPPFKSDSGLDEGDADAGVEGVEEAPVITTALVSINSPAENDWALVWAGLATAVAGYITAGFIWVKRRSNA